MKNIYKLILCSLLIMGCNDDFLNTSPEDSISKENYFNSETDLQLYMNGLLSLSGYGLFLGDQGTDNTATTAAVEIKNILVGSPSSENISSGWSWSRLRSINFFLENFEKADIDQGLKDHFEGLAKYHRADFYYDKIKRYSDVPWYSSTLEVDDDELFKPRDPRTMVVDSLIKDVQFASTHIKENVAFGDISKWAALMLQAKIALHEGTFRKYHPELQLESTANRFLEIAEDAALEIVNSKEFEIHNTGNPTEDYAALFTTDNLSSISEAILVNVYDVDKEKTSGNSNVFGDYEQSPSKSLVESYLMTDGSTYQEQANANTNSFVNEFQNRDPRLYQTLAYPGWIRAGSTTPYIQNLNKNFTGYHQTKGLNNTVESAGVDIAVFRYAEALLILAEVKAELGTLTQQDLDNTVNQLRQRVGMPNLILTDANLNVDPVLSSLYPNVSGINTGVILEIRRERRVEFAMESKRFDDLMRWHLGKRLEVIPIGMYFPGLGKYDMTGDGVEDISLIAAADDIPSPKEQNLLGIDLIYYKAGNIGEAGASLFLSNGTSGNMVTSTTQRNFVEPKYYYRPIPSQQVLLNPNLTQIMGW